MNPAGRARAAQQFPARWMDVSLEEGKVYEIVQIAMKRHHYSPHGEVVTGAGLYQFGSPVKEIIYDVLPLDPWFRMLGIPIGWADIAAWMVPVPGGVRLTVSLVKGVFHSKVVSEMAAELVEEFRVNGALIQASEPFTGLDLPLDSPGRPAAHRKRDRASG